jgi:hypothetical protein
MGPLARAGVRAKEHAPVSRFSSRLATPAAEVLSGDALQGLASSA